MTILEGRYRLVEQLGKGGFGAVWLAYDEHLGGLCAVKQSHLGKPEMAELLESEATLLANLNHPGLPRIRDHFVAADCAYLIMDYVEGGDLAMLLANEPRGVDPARVVAWVSALSDAVQYLHSLPEPILHRDIKPSNVKLTPDGRVVLLDFGIAREATAATIGLRHAITPGYSPPEQYRGLAEPGSDVYGLAATAYALLTGKAPTPAHARLAGEALPPPSTLRASVPPELDAPIMQALDLDPANRPSSATLFSSALSAALQLARPSRPAAGSTRSGRRALGGWLLGAAVLVLALGGLLWGMAARSDPTIAAATPQPSRPAATPSPRPTPTAPAPPPTPPPLVAGISGVLYVGMKDDGGQYQIYRMPADGSPPAALTSQGSNYGPALSPDGRRIAFTSERDGREQVYVMNVDGSDQRRVSPPEGLSQYVAWSPDGGSLAYSHNADPAAAQDDAGWRVVTQPLDSAAITVLANTWGTWPAWGPAGIAFTSREIVGGEAQLSLSLVQPDGSGLTVLNPTRDRDEHYPQWSADGRRLLYVAGDSKRLPTRQVWMMNADGSDAHPLTRGIGGVAMPAWSPDEKHVVFLAKWGGILADEERTQFNLWIVSSEGGAARPFTVSPTAKFGLDWGE